MSDTIVVVGASAAGVGAALGARDAGYTGEIILLGAEPGLPYERPALSKALLVPGGEPPSHIVSRETLEENRIEFHDRTRVTELGLESGTVITDNGDELGATSVVLATGARVRRIAFQNEPASGIHYLRDLDDARDLIRTLESSSGPIVLLGGGYIGLEVASVAVGLQREVYVIDAGSHLLGRGGMMVIGDHLQQIHERRGVKFLLDHSVRRLHSRDTSLTAVELNDGMILPAATLVVGIGVQPRDELAVAAGLDIDNGVRVDRFGRTSNPFVWAAGDVANQPHPMLLKAGRIEHWQVAMEHGRAVGASAAGTPTEYTAVPYFWSDQYDFSLRMFGRADANDHVVRRESATGHPVWFWIRQERLSAVASTGAPREVRAAKGLIESGQRVVLEDLMDPTVDLRMLR
ncbi:MAG: pyridine nucleotide-disulfide oxidoreductase [Pseudonocardia sp.]|nr:MAG: pyridine nucleotide-disulfide oxidoreductase [Pseudonocardia sp.]